MPCMGCLSHCAARPKRLRIAYENIAYQLYPACSGRVGGVFRLPYGRRPPVNILIEDAESLRFLTSGAQWTANAAEGKCFSGTRLAFKAAKQELIGKFNVVGYILSTKQFVNLDHGQGKGAALPSPAVTSPLPEPVVPRPPSRPA